MDVFACIFQRRDVRHFLDVNIPDEIVDEALLAAHHAPSVGLSTPWRFVVTRNAQIKQDVQNLYESTRENVEKKFQLSEEKISIHNKLKLAAIQDSPLGVAVFCEEPSEDEYTIGVVGSRETLHWSCACAIQNFWLALTAKGYGAGWVSILNFKKMNSIFSVPESWHFMGYLCVGKPATDYGGQPMLSKEGWRQRPPKATIIRR